MPQHISISTDQKDHLAAAKALSEYLTKLNIPHAFIGGFAWSLLGSTRPTEDIDVLIVEKNIEELRQKLIEEDGRFADFGVKLYFVTQERDGRLPREDLVRSTKNNVLVETLSAGTVGLPSSINSTYEVGVRGILILHPSTLILTKFKRWCFSRTSTRPETLKKVASDRRDIVFIIGWLAERSECIRFDNYSGKTKPELLEMIRTYYDKYAEDTKHVEQLRSIMPDDWDAMLAMPVREPEDLNPPP